MRLSSSIIFLLISLSCMSLSAQSALNRPEVKQKLHEFDFWLGEWNVYKTGTDTIVGFSHIESIIDSVGIQENYHAAGSPYQGTSINKYNFAKQQWEQYWVDNGGQTLHITGNLKDGKMILQNKAQTFQGQTIFNRITWHNHPDQTVQQVWEQSPDGKTWKAVFDGTYRKKK